MPHNLLLNASRVVKPRVASFRATQKSLKPFRRKSSTCLGRRVPSGTVTPFPFDDPPRSPIVESRLAKKGPPTRLLSQQALIFRCLVPLRSCLVVNQLGRFLLSSSFWLLLSSPTSQTFCCCVLSVTPNLPQEAAKIKSE